MVSRLGFSLSPAAVRAVAMTDLLHGEAATAEAQAASKILFGGGLEGIGEGTFNEIVAEGKKFFKEVKVFKPKSSRKDSKESFIICRKVR